MPEPQHTIDVIIPAYNAQDFIVQAISSVKSQTYPASTIVVDDGSTDMTGQIVKSTFGADPSVSYIRKGNGGPSSARNRGIVESRAEFVAFLDSDDIWMPDKLADQIELFRKSNDPKLGLVYCDYVNIDPIGQPLQDGFYFKLNHKVRGDVFNELLCGNQLAGSDSAALVKRECFETAGLFDESLPSCEDWDMWLRLARHYHVDYVSKPLVQLRRHSKTIQRSTRTMFQGYMMFFSKWVSEAADKPVVLAIWRKDYAVWMAASVIKELPQTHLYELLKAYMSPELKRVAVSQIPQIGIGMVVAFIRRIYRDLRRLIPVQ